MNVQVSHIVVHTPEQVQGIVQEAARIADESILAGEQWIHAFRAACDLLGQRWTFAATPEPVDLSRLKLPGRVA